MVSRFVPIALAFALVAIAGFAAGGSDSPGSASTAEKEMIRNAGVSYRKSPGMAAQSTMCTGYQQ